MQYKTEHFIAVRHCMLRTMKYVCTKKPMLAKDTLVRLKCTSMQYSFMTDAVVHENHSFAPFRPFSTLDTLCMHTIGLTTHSECGIVST